MCRWVDALASLGSRAYSAVSCERKGRERMAAQEHNGGGSPSLNPTRVDHSLDELARGLASGTISRGKALRWMGSALVGAALAVVPGVAWAASCPQGQTRCNNRCVNLQKNERHCGCCFHRCAEGQKCVSGVCQGPCQPVGGFCTNNNQCCSYNCDPNTGCVPRNPCREILYLYVDRLHLEASGN